MVASSNGTVDTNDWLSNAVGNLSPAFTHMAVSRVGGSVYVCYDEKIRVVEADPITFFEPAVTFRRLQIGLGWGSSTAFSGDIANMRIVKGVGLYSGSVNDDLTIEAFGPHA